MIPGKTIQVNGEMPAVSANTQGSNEKANNLVPILITQINPSNTEGAYFSIKKSVVYFSNEAVVKQLIDIMDYVENNHRQQGVSNYNFPEQVKNCLRR